MQEVESCSVCDDDDDVWFVLTNYLVGWRISKRFHTSHVISKEVNGNPDCHQIFISHTRITMRVDTITRSQIEILLPSSQKNVKRKRQKRKEIKFRNGSHKQIAVFRASPSSRQKVFASFLSLSALTSSPLFKRRRSCWLGFESNHSYTSSDLAWKLLPFMANTAVSRQSVNSSSIFHSEPTL